MWMYSPKIKMKKNKNKKHIRKCMVYDEGCLAVFRLNKYWMDYEATMRRAEMILDNIEKECKPHIRLKSEVGVRRSKKRK